MTNTSEEWIHLGKLGKPHGVRGELLFWPSDDSPKGALRMLEGLKEIEIRWPNEGGRVPTRCDEITRARMQSKKIVLALASLNDRNAAEALPRHGEVWAPAGAVRGRLEENEKLISDLIGREAIDWDEKVVGQVVDVETGPQDLLLIEPTEAWWKSRGHDPVAEPPKTFRLPYVSKFVNDWPADPSKISVMVPPGIEIL